MKLFKLENKNLTISEEALTLRAFSRIWKRDKSKDKNKAISELSYLFFMYDPRSDFMCTIEDEVRHDEVCLALGLSNFKKDKDFIEAENLYKRLTTTISSKLLDDAKSAIIKMSTYLRSINFDEKDSYGKLVNDSTKIVNTLKLLPSLVKSIIETEKAVNKELNDTSKMKGGKEKSILEDGLW